MSEQKTFREDPYVHGVARGLQERYDISDDVYSYLVYGLELPVDEHGEIADGMSNAVAIMAIMPPLMQGGVPMPVVAPIPSEGSDANAIYRDIDDVSEMEVVAFRDDDDNVESGVLFSIQPEQETGVVLLGTDDDGEDDSIVVDIRPVSELDTAPTINGTSVIGHDGFQMANDDDEHEKDWWRFDDIEEQFEEETA